MMETTQLDFFLEIQISPFGASMVCLDLQAMEGEVILTCTKSSPNHYLIF